MKLATEEDKAWGIDSWAELFKAVTWEGLKMIAQNSEYLAEMQAENKAALEEKDAEIARLREQLEGGNM